MNDNTQVSQELLNAFVDDQLDDEEREWILELQLDDEVLQKRVAEQTRLKELVRSARPHTPTADMKPAGLKKRSQVYRVATAAVILVTIVCSLLMMQGPAPLLGREFTSILQAHEGKREIKLLVHFNHRDDVSAIKALDQIGLLIARADEMVKPVFIEVVANGPGLAYLRMDQSPMRTLISKLMSQHDTLIFAACQETILKQGTTDVPLVPGVMIVSSGWDEIDRRKEQGWSYISI